MEGQMSESRQREHVKSKYHFPNANSLKPVRNLINEIKDGVEDSDRVCCGRQIERRYQVGKEQMSGGASPSFSSLVETEPVVDYLTEKVPAIIVCIAFIIAGGLGGFLPQAILVAVLIIVGSYFTLGVSEEHMISEDNRLLKNLEESISSINRATKVKKRQSDRQEYLHVLLFLANGAVSELKDDLCQRTHRE